MKSHKLTTSNQDIKDNESISFSGSELFMQDRTGIVLKGNKKSAGSMSVGQGANISGEGNIFNIRMSGDDFVRRNNIGKEIEPLSMSSPVHMSTFSNAVVKGTGHTFNINMSGDVISNSSHQPKFVGMSTGQNASPLANNSISTRMPTNAIVYSGQPKATASSDQKDDINAIKYKKTGGSSSEVSLIGTRVFIDGQEAEKIEKQDVKDDHYNINQNHDAFNRAIQESLKEQTKQEAPKKVVHEDPELEATLQESLVNPELIKFATQKLQKPLDIKSGQPVQQENKVETFSSLVQDYLSKIQENQRISTRINTLNLTDEEKLRFDSELTEMADPITLSLIDVPVCLNEKYYSVQTILTLKGQDPFIQGEAGKFRLDQIQTGRTLLNQCDKLVKEINRLRQEKLNGVSVANQGIFSINQPGRLSIKSNNPSGGLSVDDSVDLNNDLGGPTQQTSQATASSSIDNIRITQGAQVKNFTFLDDPSSLSIEKNVCSSTTIIDTTQMNEKQKTQAALDLIESHFKSTKKW